MRVSVVVAAACLALVTASGCPPSVPAGEGEGEGDPGGEGEGDPGGEGEGDPGGEGEGDPGGEGEGEGDPGGEGEGEGDGTGDVGVACDEDSDCLTALDCSFDTTGGALRTTCQNPSGAGLPPGSPCDDATDCDRGLCVVANGVGTCSAPCANDNDCASTQVCQTRSVTVGGVGAVLDVCVANGNLPAEACDENADCAASGRVCNALSQVGGDLVLQCGFPGSGTGQLGDLCTGDFFENPEACATGLCDGDVNGMCTIACNDDVDCGNGFICTGSGFTNIPGLFCGDSCTKEADCAGAGRACRLRTNEVENLFDLICGENRGVNTSGTDVPAGSFDCETGFPLNDRGARYCTEFCAVAGDCPAGAGLTRCVDVNLTKPNGGTQVVQACARP